MLKHIYYKCDTLGLLTMIFFVSRKAVQTDKTETIWLRTIFIGLTHSPFTAFQKLMFGSAKRTNMSHSKNSKHRKISCTNYEKVNCPDSECVLSVQRFFSCKKCQTKFIQNGKKMLVKMLGVQSGTFYNKYQQRLIANIMFEKAGNTWPLFLYLRSKQNNCTTFKKIKSLEKPPVLSHWMTMT